MNTAFVNRIALELDEIKTGRAFKSERIISGERGAEIIVEGKTVLNFCANNYLGLSLTQSAGSCQNTSASPRLVWAV